VSLTANTFTAFKDSSQRLYLKKLNIELTRVHTIRVLPPINPFGEFSFEICAADKDQKIFSAESKEDLAEWVIAIDGFVKSVQNNCFNTCIEPVPEKRNLLRTLFFDQYKGGIIKSKDEGDEWEYRPNGTVTCLMMNNKPAKIIYEWDGEFFKPKKSIDGNLNYGIGHWNGVWCGWYLQDWMVLQSTGQREKFLKYFFDREDRKYVPENKGLTVWRWSRHFLVPTSDETSEDWWQVEGSVPEPVVMFLQLIRYSIHGYKENDDYWKPAQRETHSSPMEEDTDFRFSILAMGGLAFMFLGGLAFKWTRK